MNVPLIIPEGAYLLVWVVVIAILISVLLLGTIFGHRVDQLYKERKLKRGVMALQTNFEALILGNMSEAELLRLANSHREAAQYLSLRYSALLKGKSKQKIFDVASKLGFIDKAIKGTRSFSWKIRENSAMEIGVFGYEDAIVVLQAMVRDRRSEVRHTALRSMSLLDTSLAFGALIKLLEQPGLLDVARIMEIVREVNNPDIGILNGKLLDSEQPIQTRLFLLDLVGEWAEYRVASTLHDLLKDEKKEIIIRSIKALGRIGDESSIPYIVGLIDHEEWEVRTQAIRAIAAFDYMEALPLIANCLADPAYWVRRAAAEELVGLGPEGERYLEIDKLPDDRFARDIANYIRGRTSDEMLAETIKTSEPAPTLQQMEKA